MVIAFIGSLKLTLNGCHGDSDILLSEVPLSKASKHASHMTMFQTLVLSLVICSCDTYFMIPLSSCHDNQRSLWGQWVNTVCFFIQCSHHTQGQELINLDSWLGEGYCIIAQNGVVTTVQLPIMRYSGSSPFICLIRSIVTYNTLVRSNSP